MPELICDTSPIQYLHQLGLLHILPALGERVWVPPAVMDELAVGRSLGVKLPDVRELDWVTLSTSGQRNRLAPRFSAGTRRD